MLSPIRFGTFMDLTNPHFTAANPGSMNVKLERTYHSLADPDTEVPFEERIKAYKYGKTLVQYR